MSKRRRSTFCRIGANFTKRFARAAFPTLTVIPENLKKPVLRSVRSTSFRSSKCWNTSRITTRRFKRRFGWRDGSSSLPFRRNRTTTRITCDFSRKKCWKRRSATPALRGSSSTPFAEAASFSPPSTDRRPFPPLPSLYFAHSPHFHQSGAPRVKPTKAPPLLIYIEKV